MKTKLHWLLGTTLWLLHLGCGATQAQAVVDSVELPNGKPGIGFDDLQWSATLGRLIIPAARTGNVCLIDPDTRAIKALPGFSKSEKYAGGHDFGTTSAVETGGMLYAIDRTTQSLVQVELSSHTRKHVLALAGSPDYVRFVAATHELWVTEPDSEQIEVIALGSEQPPTLQSKQRLRVAGGPESLVLDAERGLAYTNSFHGTTFVLDVHAHKVLRSFKNGCTTSLGIALDSVNQHVFVACARGEIASFAVQDGRALARVAVGSGIDIIAYDPSHRRVFAASGGSAELTPIKADASGALHAEPPVHTASAASCVVVDDHGRAWVCDPTHGRLLRVTLPDGH